MRKKLKLNRRIRYMALLISIALIIGSTVLICIERCTPKIRDEKISLYKYSRYGNISYNVFLKPNILYGSQQITEGETYITEFMDYINTTFKFSYTGERTAYIKGNYDIRAVVEGYSNRENGTGNAEEDDSRNSEDKPKSTKTIWKKEYILLPGTSFEESDKAVSISRNVPIKFQEYNEFARKVIESSKVNLSTRLSVIMNINLYVDTGSGPIRETITQSMVIPLNTSSFEIVKNETKEKSGVIEITKKVKLPIDYNSIIIYGLFAIILLLAFLYLVFFTEAAPEADLFTKELNSIFRKHGTRLAALSSEAATNYDNYCETRSIDDLVRIADEIEKPIMYRYSSDSNEISLFHVFDGNLMYTFDLRKYLDSILNEEKLQENEKYNGCYWKSKVKPVSLTAAEHKDKELKS